MESNDSSNSKSGEDNLNGILILGAEFWRYLLKDFLVVFIIVMTLVSKRFFGICKGYITSLSFCSIKKSNACASWMLFWLFYSCFGYVCGIGVAEVTQVFV